MNSQGRIEGDAIEIWNTEKGGSLPFDDVQRVTEAGLAAEGGETIGEMLIVAGLQPSDGNKFHRRCLLADLRLYTHGV